MIVTTAARRMSPAYPTITDSGIYPPPTTGTYAYNTDFRPALGASYRDPVFGKLVRRLTDIGANANADPNYAFHMVNADGTLCFHSLADGTFLIINTSDGSTAYSGTPYGLSSQEVRWSMTDPDKYYYWSGSSLMRRNLAAGTNTTIKTFAATLQTLGSSTNYQDATDRYFIVKYSNTAKLWDSQTDTIYANPVTPLDASGWVTITPSGNYVVTAAGASAVPNKQSYAYPVNHGTQTISTTPNWYTGLSGDHQGIMSCSDGNDYAITGAYSVAELVRAALTLDSGASGYAAQEAAMQSLVTITYDQSIHFSPVTVGPYKDWIFVATESSTDDFDEGVSGWYAYKQEIIAINVVTLVIKRLAHHRSRSMSLAYGTYPRVSCAVDGSFVVWTSNFNDSSPTGYADLWGIANPLSS